MTRTDRAVEILHNAGTDDEPDWSVGSGYLIGGRRVLTAAHNVGAGQCLVRFIDGSEHEAVVRRQGEEIRLDLAVMELTGDEVPDLGEPVSYAIVSQGQAELIPRCTGLGFPRFKEDETRARPGSGKPLRNIEQLDGEIPTAAGALSSLLTFRVTARPQELPPLPAGAAGFGESAWQGISGTVVFARDDAFGERVIGVVTEHHLAEGGSALTLVPIGAIGSAGAVSTGEQRAWWEMIGVPDPDGLPVLPRLSSRRRPSFAPPRGTVARPQLLADALAALCDGSARLVALAGPPGFGKSVLARLIAAAIDTEEGSKAPGCCPGGVVWLDVGQDPDLSGLLAERLTDLTGQPAGGRRVEQLASDLGAELAARRCLLVLDDVWPSQRGRDDVVGLLLSRMDSVPCLLTTRSAALLDAEPAARTIDVEEMEPSEAAALLASALPGQATNSDAARLGEFSRRLGRWPLLLGLAAARLRRWVSDGVPLDDAIGDLADRYAANGVTAFDARYADQLEASDPTQRDLAVAAAVKASLGLLTPEDQARYRELAVFPPGQPIPVDVIAGLWAPGLDRHSTGDLVRMLADLSLLSADWRTRLVRLHDLLRDYLVPADHSQETAQHRRLLQGWGDPLLLRDSYRIRWYAYHLDTAGDSGQLYALITPAWRDRVLAVTEALPDVAADVLRAAEHAARHHHLAEELRCRLISTALAARAGALPRPLLAALARVGRLDRALAYVSLLSPGARDQALADIATALATTDLGQALDIADRIEEPFFKAEALAKIAAPLAGTDPERALMTADRLDDPAAKGYVIARIAAPLAGTDPERALAAADRINDPTPKAEALANIATALAGADPGRARRVASQALAAANRIDRLWPKAGALANIAAALAGLDPGRADRLTAQAFAAAERIGDPDERARALADIAAALASTDPDRALAAVDRIDNPGDKARVLADTAAALASTDPDRALAAAGRIDDPVNKAAALTNVAAALASTDPDRALAAVDRIDNPGDKARALADTAAALASTDPDRARRLTAQALAAADRIDDPSNKDWALARIATPLPGIDPDQALAAADRIDNPTTKAEGLANIATALAGTDPGRARRLTDQAVAAADRIDSPTNKARGLAGIAAALAITDPDQALAVADRIDHYHYKEEALARIAAALTGTDAERALAVAERIDHPWEPLAGIAAAVAGTHPDQALAAADRINDPGERGRALAEIVAALAGTDPDRALAAAGRIDDPVNKAAALTNVAAALASTDPGRTRELTDQAIAVADRIHDSWFKAWAIANIARVLAGTDPDQALAAAERIDDPLKKAQAIADIARVLAGTDPDQALAAAERIDGPWNKARAFVWIAAALAGTDPGRGRGLTSEALAAADRIDDRRDKALALVWIAAMLVGTDPGLGRGLTSQALATAERIDNRRDKARALADIAEALAGTDPDQALAAADRIDDPSPKAEALAKIATALAGTDPDRALAVADRINDRWGKGRAFANIAAALGGTDVDRALAVADRIDDPQSKADALANVADSQAGMAYTLEAGGDRQAARLTEDLITGLRFLDAATSDEAWWKLARFLVTRAQSASERNEIVQAVLAVDEW